jgi:hypothetical protein
MPNLTIKVARDRPPVIDLVVEAIYARTHTCLGIKAVITVNLPKTWP